MAFTGPEYLRNQQLNVVSWARTQAAELLDLAEKINKTIAQWQVYGQTPAQVFATDVLAGSSHEGLDAADFSNAIGSFAAFQGLMVTHAGNLRKII